MQNNTTRPASEYRAAARGALQGNWLRTFGLILLAFACSMALPLLLSLRYLSWLSVHARTLLIHSAPPHLAAYYLTLLLSCLPALLFVPGCFSVLAQPYLGREPWIGDSFAGFRRPLHTLGTMLLTVLCALLIQLICMLPTTVGLMAGFFWKASPSSLSALLTIVQSAGFIAAFTQMLYFAPVPLLIVIRPELGARDTLRRSRQIMRGRRWSLFKLCLSCFLWVLLASFAVGLLSTLLASFFNVLASPLLSSLLSFAMLAVMLVFLLQLYSAVTGFLLHAEGVDIFGDGQQTPPPESAQE